MKIIKFCFLYIAFLFTFAQIASCADYDLPALRKIITDNEKAVVNITVVVEETVSYQGSSEKGESVSQSVGTIIDKSGLVITAYSDLISDSSTYSFMADDPDFSSSQTVKDIKLRLNDGNEIQADMVLNDTDLDIAFIAPKSKSEKEFPFIDLSNYTDLEILDPILGISRMGKVGNYSYSSAIDHINSVILKPRKMYIASNIEPSAPVFALDGKLLGISTWKEMKAGSGDDYDYLLVILPATTIQEIAKQALELMAK
ncbi:MAG: serine protease [Armatimonadota bacterium]